MKTLDDLIDQLSRGVEGLYSPQELRRKLELAGAPGPITKPLRIKLGMDPTAPDIHLGHSVVLRKMRQFQDMGHLAVLIIGDYTARIGDPTGRDTTRPILSEDDIERNARTYLDQAGKILDTTPGKLEIRRNSEWLEKLTFADVLRLTGMVTVQQMLHRENFKKRMAEDREIMVSEFMYPLMQGCDSVVIQADVELGGTDQTFNNLMGRELQAKHDQPKQVVMVMPLLVGLDGHEKMSKSKGNYVGLTDEPDDMFGKIMSISDAMMPDYYRLLTDLPMPRVTSLLNLDETHPRQAKDVLARVIVEAFHGAEAANQASENFRRRFSENKLPTDLETKQVSATPLGLLTLIREAGFASSNAEARRFVEQGAVTLDGQKMTDARAEVALEGEAVLQVGKRRICKVTAG